MNAVLTLTRVATLMIVEVIAMTFSEIFTETMKAMAHNDYARMRELEQIQKQKIAELRSKKNVQK